MSDWISVKERLPEENEHIMCVWVINPRPTQGVPCDGVVSWIYYSKADGFHNYGDKGSKSFVNGEVTHWMTSPDAPAIFKNEPIIWPRVWVTREEATKLFPGSSNE